MRRVVTFLVVAAVVIALAWGVSILPGTWTADIGGTQFQAGTPAVLALLAVLFLIVGGVVAEAKPWVVEHVAH